MRTLVYAALAGLVAAGCPNACSGHGSCSSNDICNCDNNYMGPDCSQRTCEIDQAWATDASDPHAYAECAGQGVCNRETGQCECFPGFEGRACSRSVCPNNCSGHGKCKKLSEVQTTVAYDASNWDAERIQTCECDPHYTGSDCSERLCPTGDDPLTLCKTKKYDHVQEVRYVLGADLATADAGTGTGTTTASSLPAGSVQADGFQLFGYDGTGAYSATEAKKGQLLLSYVDSWGAKYTTAGVDLFLDSTKDSDAATLMERALESLPNNKVGDVDVASKIQAIAPITVVGGALTLGAVTNNAVLQRAWTVTFKHDVTNSNNVGMQNSLQCASGYSCNNDGCNPKIRMPFLYRYASFGSGISITSLDQLADSAQNVASPAKTGTVEVFSGTGSDTAANFATNKKIVRLSADSQPQMPADIEVSTKASNAGNTEFRNLADIRVLVAVVEGDLSSNAVEASKYYTKVVYGNDNIASASEAFGYEVGGAAAKPAGMLYAGKSVGPSLAGFTYMGPIPADPTDATKAHSKVPVTGAPGVFLNFPSLTMVGDNTINFFEILIKLPHCSVTPVTKAEQLFNVAQDKALEPVDADVENIECSGRGMCDRKLGVCKCFNGYFGLACNRQTTLV